MKTLWDALKAEEAKGDSDLLVSVAPKYWHLDPAENEMRPTMTVLTPCCSVRASADSVMDMRSVTGTWVTKKGKGGKGWHDPDWLCGDCWAECCMTKEHGWTESKLARAAGAPDSVVRNLRALEIMNRDHRELRGAVREVRLREVHDSFPSTVPGTERPSVSVKPSLNRPAQ